MAFFTTASAVSASAAATAAAAAAGSAAASLAIPASIAAQTAAMSSFAFPSLATIGSIAQIGGFALAALGAANQGQATANAAKFQAGIMRQQAEAARLEGISNEEAYRASVSRKMASRRALLAASGVEGGEGSPLMVSEDFIGEAELNALKLRASGAIAATRLEQSAQMAGYEGANARRSGFGRAGALILSGAGQTFGGAGRTVTVTV